MTPLLCLSPVMLEQSFPRDDDQLSTAALALGNILGAVANGDARLILTATLRQFVEEEIDWSSPKTQGVLREIYRTFNQLFLTTPQELLQLDLSEVSGHEPHPSPLGTDPTEGLIVFWRDEVGRLLVLHDKCASNNRFFIGIACEKAFSGGEPNSYLNPSGARAFPLVGPSQLINLEDGYEWILPANAHQIIIAFDDVKRNYRAIGGVRFEPPSSGGSHYKVHFNGCRSWPCDYNWGRHIDDKMLDELKTHCSLPLNVIKYALRHGTLPERRIRLPI